MSTQPSHTIGACTPKSLQKLVAIDFHSLSDIPFRRFSSNIEITDLQVAQAGNYYE